MTITPNFIKHAEGSALIDVGDTRVICTASLQEKVPPFLYKSGRGWITAEYGMLPRATSERTEREAARGKQGGRTMEIQRLIGRSLRASVTPEMLGEVLAFVGMANETNSLANGYRVPVDERFEKLF